MFPQKRRQKMNMKKTAFTVILAIVAFSLVFSVQPVWADKKFKIVEVKIRKEASVSDYLKKYKGGKHGKWLKELLKGVGDLNNWTIETSGENVVEAHPSVDGHPGHVDGKDWKMYIERGKKTVDRLFLKKRRYTVTPSKKNPDILHVKIYAAAFVVEDTH